MLASDLDGTLVRSDNTVSVRTRTALEKAAADGFVIAFVTGRPPRWLHEIADATGHTGVCVASNGAVLYDLETETMIGERLIDPPLMLTLALELREVFPQAAFAVEYGGNRERSRPPFDTFGSEPRYTHDWAVNPEIDRRGNPVPPPLIADLHTILASPALKMLVKDRQADPDELARTAVQTVAGRATVTHSSSYGLIEIGPVGVTKASGLAQLAARHGVHPHEVAAVGDMPNDVAMLEWAGRSYAVANAHPSVLAVADEVLPSNDEDGVAVLVERLLASHTRG